MEVFQRRHEFISKNYLILTKDSHASMKTDSCAKYNNKNSLV